VSTQLNILNIVGARPNFMKIAPLMRAMAQAPGVQGTLVHTGQHYDTSLSQVFFDELGIPRPDVDLGVGSAPRLEQIERIERAFEPLLIERRPDVVLVVGDVNSTIACAAVARRHGVKVAHVEAGLRSFDDAMPEELNRRETDEISDLLFVTEPSGLRNLENEGAPGRAFLVGNVMIDTLVAHLERARETRSAERLGVAGKDYLVTTFHRPSNVDTVESLSRLVEALGAMSERLPVVLPLHPRTRASLERHALSTEIADIPGLTLTEPLGYLDFIGLVAGARGVVTDSGGIQEETTYLDIPCVTMRENTERPVTIEVGTNELVGSDFERLIEHVDAIAAGRFKRGAIPDLWDGRAALRIVEILRRELRAAA
jgi:UDP-N-acetylglucosamine 2-epimerase (non-hydrolysing)